MSQNARKDLTIEDIERANDLFVAITEKIAREYPSLAPYCGKVEKKINELLDVMNRLHQQRLSGESTPATKHQDQDSLMQTLARTFGLFDSGNDAFTLENIDIYLEMARRHRKEMQAIIDHLEKMKGQLEDGSR